MRESVVERKRNWSEREGRKEDEELSESAPICEAMFDKEGSHWEQYCCTVIRANI